MNDIDKTNCSNKPESVEGIFSALIRQNVSNVNNFKCDNLIEFAEFGNVAELYKGGSNYLEGATKQLYNKALALAFVAYKIATHDPNYNFYDVQTLRINNLMQEIKNLEFDILNCTKADENVQEVLDKIRFFEDRGVKYLDELN